MKTILYSLLFISTTALADSIVIVDQIGSNNTITVEQKDADNNYVKIKTGAVSSVDYTTFSVLQQGTGAKTADVEIKSGINNTVNLTQDGAGNHKANVIGLMGSGNNIAVNQSGAGSHEFKVDNLNGSTNNGNTVTATQSGGAGADKWFALKLTGATGANVTVTQNNPTTPNQGSMSIQCNPCGAWSYVRN
jgi:hypothetical protein